MKEEIINYPFINLLIDDDLRNQLEVNKKYSEKMYMKYKRINNERNILYD